MRREITEKLAKEFGLIPSHVSREIMRSITFGMDVDPVVYEYVTRDELRLVSSEYQRECSACSLPANAPRNFPAYRIIAREYPVKLDPAACTHINRDVPKLRGMIPSLASFLFRRVPREMEALELTRRYPELDGSSDLLRKLDRVLAAVPLVWPEPARMRSAVEWFQRLAAGSDGVIFTPLCPDYSYVTTGSAARPFEYTFEYVGDGVGLVGMRYTAILASIMPVLHGLGWRPRLVAGRGDFEGLNPETLRRVGLDRAAFRARCEASQRALRATTSYTLETPQISDMAGGLLGWSALVQDIEDQLQSGNFGQTGLSEERVERLLDARMPLYRAWFGSSLDREEGRHKLLQQGAEYAAMGVLASRLPGDPLVLGADHAAMSAFYAFEHPLPVLYVERNYR